MSVLFVSASSNRGELKWTLDFRSKHEYCCSFRLCIIKDTHLSHLLQLSSLKHLLFKSSLVHGTAFSARISSRKVNLAFWQLWSILNGHLEWTQTPISCQQIILGSLEWFSELYIVVEVSMFPVFLVDFYLLLKFDLCFKIFFRLLIASTFAYALSIIVRVTIMTSFYCLVYWDLKHSS